MNKETLQNYNNRLEKNNISLQDVLDEVNKLQEISLQDKTVTPTKTQQTITHDTGFNGLGAIIVEPIPNEYIVPSGTLDITENGTQDVTNYAEVNVNVETTSGGGGADLSEYFTESIGTDGSTSITWKTAFKKFPPLPLLGTNANSIYNGCTTSEIDLSAFKDVKVTNLSYTFSSCTGVETLDLDEIDFSNVTNMDYMFSGCTKLKTLDMRNRDLSKVTSDLKYTFSGCTALEELDFTNTMINASNLTGTFENCNALKTINFGDNTMSGLRFPQRTFYYCTNLENLDLSKIEPDNLSSLYMVFYKCSKLKSLDLSHWDVSNVSNFGSTFSLCSALTSINLSGWDTGATTTMSSMFSSCSSFTKLDLSSFRLKPNQNVNMSYIFSNCTLLEEIDLSGLENVGKGSNLKNAFQNCKALQKLDIRKLDFSVSWEFNTAMLSGVPTTCLIIVKDDTAKQWFATNFGAYTNVKTVAEL